MTKGVLEKCYQENIHIYILFWYLLLVKTIQWQCLKFDFRSLHTIPNDTYNHEVSKSMLLLCLIHGICTLPHMIYSYAFGTYHSGPDHVYNILLGMVWFPYGCNFIIYVMQQDRYWNAYKFYIEEKQFFKYLKIRTRTN